MYSIVTYYIPLNESELIRRVSCLLKRPQANEILDNQSDWVLSPTGHKKK